MPRVAVLTNSGTAASGELVAMSFLGRPGTRSFGEGTCGMTRANRSFDLGDGAVLYLVSAIEADRNGHEYGWVSLVPDEQLDAGVTVGRAVDWLHDH
jgi:C-terminal processing protease CtpA/Prc